MKKISIVLFSIIIALSASAQKVIVHPVVPVGPRIAYYHPYFWHPYYGFGYSWYYGPRPYYYYHPTKLDRQIVDIENEYSDRIYSVRQDDSLTHHERRMKIRELKRERYQAIEDAKRNYYKQYEN
ncbi:MAG TPA: hypothetical protein VHB70_18205 [Parafilimonas sp.]|nr:hypothetical protein [Parafilimonas sp.]